MCFGSTCLLLHNHKDASWGWFLFMKFKLQFKAASFPSCVFFQSERQCLVGKPSGTTWDTYVLLVTAFQFYFVTKIHNVMKTFSGANQYNRVTFVILDCSWLVLCTFHYAYNIHIPLISNTIIFSQSSNHSYSSILLSICIYNRSFTFYVWFCHFPISCVQLQQCTSF